MKLEHQVCSLDLAKKLKELGVKQDSLFIWSTHTKPSTLWWEPALMEKSGYTSDSLFAAFTVAELGEIMKDKGMGTTAHSGLGTGSGWWVRGGEWSVEKQQYSQVVHGEEKWADALAKMLIHLIENKLIELPTN